MKDEDFHKPVLLKEVIEALNIRKGKKYIDATFGGGGHTKEILKRGGLVLGIDQDSETISKLKTKNEKVKTYIKNKKLILKKGNFRNLKKIAEENSFDKVAGILFDLGLSSWQIEKSGKGFSYLRDEPLDMRIDSSQKITAAEIINHSTREELYEIFTKFGEEINSRAIVNAIFRAHPIKTTRELVEVIGGKNTNQLARVFQALRIIVNDELDNLKITLSQAIDLLEKNGRLVIISFHSLEDRIVKFSLRTKNLKIITKKLIRPSREEIIKNTRARSARMRVAERI
ncbi:16S rRNA (cytosine(1402)-N(4))-methyltransferase RsmH [Candidatus Microgenomates bacterium]|nr:16S rRNA (cytosine(1402)-N(4))-methyltransferase RsmH [Candidatus Microgenomates bacterium]